MPEEKKQSPDFQGSFGKIAREKISETLKVSHNLIKDTAEQVYSLLNLNLQGNKNNKEEREYLIPILVEYSLYGADDVGRDLGEVSRGILEGVARTAKELNLNAGEMVEKTARAMILESDWRDIDLRIVIENFIKKEIPDGKNLIKKIYSSEKSPESTRKAA